MGIERTWGSFFDVTGDFMEHDFDVSNGGFIGVYGSYTDMLNAVGPYYNPGDCTCDDTELIN